MSRRTGEAITLVTRKDWKVASELIDILERAKQVRKNLSNIYIGSGLPPETIHGDGLLTLFWMSVCLLFQAVFLAGVCK